jgi:hypothetical protein
VFGLDEDRARAAVQAAAPSDYAGVINALFRAFAQAKGKARWADKTPGNVDHIDLLADLFVDGRFIHVIRDGRDVAVSLSEQSWGPRSSVSGAYTWRRRVEKGRDAGVRLGTNRYMEVRLEDLTADPEGILRSVCAFIGEDFDQAMLTYYDGPGVRAAVVPTHRSYMTRRHLLEPPTAGLRDWRADCPSDQQSAVEAICYPLLRTLAYPEPQPPDVGARVRARVLRGQDLLLDGVWRELARRARGWRRDF